MTETSYYHVGSHRLYPPPSQDDDLSRRSVGDQTQLDDHSYQYSVDRSSVDNYDDASQLNPNPLYRSDDEFTGDVTEADQRYLV